MRGLTGFLATALLSLAMACEPPGLDLDDGGGYSTAGDSSFTFFVIGDTRTYQNEFKKTVASMTALDPDAVAIFNGGDLTANGDSSEWRNHLEKLDEGSDGLARADLTSFTSEAIRYIGVLGNHDEKDSDWYDNWNRFLPGQADLGVNSEDGIYFSLTHKNALFIILDSEHPSSAQTNWLRDQLENVDESRIAWKFVFFHAPVYPCNAKPPFDEGIPWVRMFETYGVDVAFVAHSHTYERTCPMIGGQCADGGVVYINSSAAGVDPRAVDPDKRDNAGGDDYRCGDILKDSKGDWRHYCHIELDGTQFTQKCYSHTSSSSPVFTYTMNKPGGDDGGEGGEGTGLLGTYYNNKDLTDQILERVDPTVGFSWGTDAPAPSIGADTFSVRWEGEVEAPYTGTYTFYTWSDDGTRLWVDGRQLVDNWTDHSATEDSGTIELEAGRRYPIKLEYYENRVDAVMRLRWAGPDISKSLVPKTRLYNDVGGGDGDGLVGTYFDNIDLTDEKARRTDGTVNFDWGSGTPAGLSSGDTFSVRWVGSVEPRYTQRYDFHVKSDDGARLWVDNQLLIDEWNDHGPATTTGSIDLEAGRRYSIKLEYYENRGGAMVQLEWSSVSQSREIIPKSQLFSDGGVTDIVIYEAEARSAASGCNERSNHTGYTGTGFMDYGGSGTWIEWNDIYAPHAGDYALTFRYAVGSAAQRPSALVVNGAAAGTVAFANTGSWINWGTVSIDVALAAGDNTIRVVASTGFGGPNLDHVAIAGGEEPPPQCSNQLDFGDSLENGEFLCSANGAYEFGLTSDGQLILREGSTVIWDAGISGATLLAMQASDGNLVAYRTVSNPWQPLWASNTNDANHRDAVSLVVQDSGRAELRFLGSVIWYVDGDDEPPPVDDITHIGTTEAYDSNGQNMAIARPSGTASGDLLILVLHRTDDDLPLYVDGWTRVAECFKGGNGNDCGTEEDCTSWHNSDFCASFDGNGGGHDLAQSVFYRVVGPAEPNSYEFDLNRDSSGHPGWAILTGLRGANTSDPVRDWAHEGCDGHSDSVFPSVYGHSGDMVLMSQSFDDAVAQSKFGPPTGASAFGYVSQSDEAGFLFGRVLTSTGETGSMKTHGDGASSCKDGLVSLTIKPE